MRIGSALMAVGALLLVVGAIVRFGPSWLYSWFGHLPGDIRVEGRKGSFYAPITSMLVVSVAASLILNVIARFYRGE